MGKKSSWSILKARKPQETITNRDVYEDQQLERSTIQEKKSPVSRIVFGAIISVLVACMTYVVVSLSLYGFTLLQNNMSSTSSSGTQVAEQTNFDWDNIIVKTKDLRYIIDENKDGQPDDGVFYDNKITLRQVYTKQHSSVQEEQPQESSEKKQVTLSSCFKPNLWNVLISLSSGLILFAFLYQVLMRNLAAQNVLADTSDINQYQNDQHIAVPDEIVRAYDFFPDVGAHSSVSVSSLISHVALSNKGLKPVMVGKFAKEDMKTEDGEKIFKGELLTDDEGNPILEKKPIIDEKFMEALFDASDLPKDKNLRRRFDASSIPYNEDGTNRDKLKYKMVSDLINGDWFIPVYEPQRPGGAYIVDTAPVNTMV